MIAGRVWLDLDNDGTINGSEVGIGSVQVDLAGAISGGGAVARSVTSNPDGSFEFVGLPPGTYRLEVTVRDKLADKEATSATLFVKS